MLFNDYIFFAALVPSQEVMYVLSNATFSHGKLSPHDQFKIIPPLVTMMKGRKVGVATLEQTLTADYF